MFRLLSDSQRKDLETATAAYQGNIQQAASYLGSRGIDAELAERYRLGVVGPSPSPGHEQYVGRLAIPYLTRAGVALLRFRCLQDHKCSDSGCAKYITPAGSQGTLYNVEALFAKSDTLVICEGEIDAITVTEYAGLPAIAVAGVQAWKPHFTRAVQGYDRILVAGDGDTAGREFASGLAVELGGTPVHLPDGEDCNSILVRGGERDLIGLFYG